MKIQIAKTVDETALLNRLNQNRDFQWLIGRLAVIAAEKVREGQGTDGTERFRLDGDARTLLGIHEEVTGSQSALMSIAQNATPKTNRIPVRPARV